MKKGVYKNIVELAKENGVYNTWSKEVDGKFEDYLDDYCDRDIVTAFLSDMSNTSTNGFKFKVKPKWVEGGLNWRKTTIEIL